MRLPVALLCGLTVVAHAQTRTVAITIDDLPCAFCSTVNPDGSSGKGSMESTNQRLVRSLARNHVPVTGFVIAGFVNPQAIKQSGGTGLRALQFWWNAGFDLANHSDSHPNFAEISAEQMEADVARADGTLRPLLAAHGQTLRFFRYPYNNTGDTQAKHDQFAAFLKARGYQVATCTIDTSDYIFAAAYSRALGANDAATAARIRHEYLTYSAVEIDFYAALNRRVLGYEPPEVMLLHDSLLNSDTVDDVLALFRNRGCRFVSLADAQRDPAYATPDTYITKYGPMWGYRWAQEKQAGKLGLREEEPPDWIVEYSKGPQDKAREAPAAQ
jgi:peptidoglycan/xylan/chitin deacetylase (PgdA/CDA1 family)